MFGRLAAVVASLCALCSALVAGTGPAPARSARSIRHQFAIQHHNPGVQRAVWQRPAWPPLRQARVRPPNQKRDAARPAGTFGDAFMVDTVTTLAPMVGNFYSYGVAPKGDGWRVLWADLDDYSARTTGIDSAGALRDPRGVTAGYFDYMISLQPSCLAATGTGFVAVWPSENQGILGAALDSSGVPLDSFLVFQSDSGQAYPAIAFDGDSTCLVVWTESPYGDCDILAARVTTSGQVLDSIPIVLAADPVDGEQMPAVAYGQGEYLVAWTAATSMAVVSRAVRVSRDGAVLDSAITLRKDAGMMSGYPTVAYGDTCFLAAWSEGMQQAHMLAARISVAGTLIDTVPVQLTDGPGIEVLSSVAFDGDRYLLMWSAFDSLMYASTLCGRRITADCVPLDSTMIWPQFAGCVSMYPSVAAGENGFLVACTAQDTLSYDNRVACVRISPEGAVLDSEGIYLPMGPDDQLWPCGASDGTDFLAAWFETRNRGLAIGAARIAADGTVLDPAGLAANEEPYDKGDLAVGYGDSIYLLAWADYRGAESPDIYCARVSSDGQVLDTNGIVVCDAVSYQFMPDVSFDGSNFLVAWQDLRGGMTDNIYAARVSPAGVLLDPGGIAVAVSDTFNDTRPVVCFTGTDHLVVWQGYNENQSSSNIYGALVSPAGTITKPRFRVSSLAGDYQIAPSVARGSTTSLAAWEDMRDMAYTYAARIRADGTVLDTAGICLDSSDYELMSPRVTPDEAGFRVLWSRYGYADSTYFGVAQVDTAGRLVRAGNWFAITSSYQSHDAVYGSGPDLLLLFSCKTDTAMGHSYDADRVWGRLGNVPGIQESYERQAIGATPMPTVVRGVLHLNKGTSASPTSSCLLDVSGRKVMELQAGANDVSRLAPGVYFVGEGAGTGDQGPGRIRKVVVTR